MIRTAVFSKSSPSLRDCPEGNLPEFAFIGRSNVGKSSLINMLTGKKGLAKTSSLPGKTRLINHFLVNDQWFLVDLPGYGYAKLPRSERDRLQKMIYGYLGGRMSLRLTFLLVDARHEPQRSDLEFMEWMAEHGKPFVLLFTKTDKLSKTQLANSIGHYREVLKGSWDELPHLVLTSATTKLGKEEVFNIIDSMLGNP